MFENQENILNNQNEQIDFIQNMPKEYDDAKINLID